MIQSGKCLLPSLRRVVYVTVAGQGTTGSTVCGRSIVALVANPHFQLVNAVLHSCCRTLYGVDSYWLNDTTSLPPECHTRQLVLTSVRLHYCAYTVTNLNLSLLPCRPILGF